jgi:hypothetical protein
MFSECSRFCYEDTFELTHFLLSKLVVAVMVLTNIQQVTSSDFGWVTGHLVLWFLWFYSAPIGKVRGDI